MIAPSEPGRPTALTLKMEVLLSYETSVIFTSRHAAIFPIISNLQAIILFSKVSRLALRPTKTTISRYRGQSGRGLKINTHLHSLILLHSMHGNNFTLTTG